jgi:hypothetical protein
MSDKLDVDLFKSALPAQVKKSVTQDLVDTINTLVIDPDFRENYRENLLSFTSVLSKGRFKLKNYVDAVRYVSFKLLGDNNKAAYIKTFPDKYARFTQNGVLEKDIASYIHAYNKSKLVCLIWEQTLTPTYILNQDHVQQAINTQVGLMMHAKSEKVRCDAANSLLVHLKMPETQKVELDIGIKKDKSIDALRDATKEFIEMQKQMIASGNMTAQEVAHSKLVIDGDSEEITDV